MLNSARRHRLALGVAAAGSALALAACGADDPQPAEQDTAAEEAEDVEEEDADGANDGGDFNQGPIPDEAPEADEADLPDEPADDAPLSERLGWDAIETVSSFAKVGDPDAAADCPDIEGEEGETATCTITYLGEELEYSLEIEGGGILVTYDWELSEAPLQREVVEDTLRVRAETEEVRCDMDDVLMIVPGADDVATCEAQDGDRVRDYSVSIGDTGTLSVYEV